MIEYEKGPFVVGEGKIFFLKEIKRPPRKNGKKTRPGKVKLYCLENIAVDIQNLYEFSRKIKKGNKLAAVLSRTSLTNISVVKNGGNIALVSGQATYQALEILNLHKHVVFRFANGSY